MLKILLHGLNFAPEEIGIGKYSGELVEDLLMRGCKVTVVTTPPYYPHWLIGKGYRGWWYSILETGVREMSEETTVSLAKALRLNPTLPARLSDLLKRDPANSGDSNAHSRSHFRIKVIRCPLWVPQKVNGWKRILHLASFGLSSIPVVLWQAVRYRPDVIMTIEPTAFCMPTTLLAAKLCGAKTWLHVQDFEVDAAFELGILKQPLLKQIVLFVEAWLMRRFDRVSSISPKMVERLQSKRVETAKMRLFPNWVDCQEMRPLNALKHGTAAAGKGPKVEPGEEPDKSQSANSTLSNSNGSQGCAPHVRPTCPMRSLFGIPANKCIAMYAGNIGAKQGLELIVAAARLLQTQTDIHFVICGHGAAYAALEQSVCGMDNVQLLPVQPFDLFNQLMNCADVHLLPQKGDAADLVMPSKLTGMLATGRPVVACASPDTQIAQVVEGRGCVVPPGDEVAFTQAIEELANNPHRRHALGHAARRYAVEHLGREAILTRFAAELRQLVELAPKAEMSRMTIPSKVPQDNWSALPAPVPAPHLSFTDDKSLITDDERVELDVPIERLPATRTP